MGSSAILSCAFILAVFGVLSFNRKSVDAVMCWGCIWPAVYDPANAGMPNCVNTGNYSSYTQLPFCDGAEGAAWIDCGSNYRYSASLGAYVLMGPYCATYYGKNSTGPIVRACGTHASGTYALSNGYGESCCADEGCTPDDFNF